PVGDLGTLEAAASLAARARFEAESAVNDVRRALEAITTRLERLRQGEAVYPEAVERMIEALQAAGVEATLVSSTVELTDSMRAESLVASLGPARYSVIAAPSDVSRAVELANKLKLPGPVYRGEPATDTMRAGPLMLRSGAAGCIPAWLERVSL